MELVEHHRLLKVPAQEKKNINFANRSLINDWLPVALFVIHRTFQSSSQPTGALKKDKASPRVPWQEQTRCAHTGPHIVWETRQSEKFPPCCCDDTVSFVRLLSKANNFVLPVSWPIRQRMVGYQKMSFWWTTFPSHDTTSEIASNDKYQATFNYWLYSQKLRLPTFLTGTL